MSKIGVSLISATMLLLMIISLFVKYCQVVVLIVFWVPKNLASNIWYFSVTLNEGLEGRKQSIFLLYVHLLHLLQLQLLLYTLFLYRLCFIVTLVSKSYNATVISRKYRPAGARLQQALQQLLEHVIVPVILALLYSKCTIFSTTAFWSVEATYGGSKSESEEVTPFLFCDVGPVFPVWLLNTLARRSYSCFFGRHKISHGFPTNTGKRVSNVKKNNNNFGYLCTQQIIKWVQNCLFLV